MLVTAAVLGSLVKSTWRSCCWTAPRAIAGPVSAPLDENFTWFSALRSTHARSKSAVTISASAAVGELAVPPPLQWDQKPPVALKHLFKSVVAHAAFSATAFLVISFRSHSALSAPEHPNATAAALANRVKAHISVPATLA